MAGDAETACLAAARELQDGHHNVLEQDRRERRIPAVVATLWLLVGLEMVAVSG